MGSTSEERRLCSANALLKEEIIDPEDAGFGHAVSPRVGHRSIDTSSFKFRERSDRTVLDMAATKGGMGEKRLMEKPVVTVKEEAADALIVKQEVEDEELWKYGGYAKRKEPVFGGNPKPKKGRWASEEIGDGGHLGRQDPRWIAFAMEQKVYVKEESDSEEISEEEGEESELEGEEEETNPSMKSEPGEAQEDNDDSTGETEVECPVEGCEDVFSTEKALKEHMTDDHFRGMNCKGCRKLFTIPCKLRLHYLTHSKSKFKCPRCIRQLKNETALEAHVRMRHPSYANRIIFKCVECGEEFSTLAKLQKHQKSHEPSVFLCPRCGAEFRRASSLAKHLCKDLRMPFPCTVCSHRSSTAACLAKHMISHEGKRPHVCVTCGNAFKEKFYLVEHSRIHSGEKPFACGECDYRAAFRSNFRWHQKTKHKK